MNRHIAASSYSTPEGSGTADAGNGISTASLGIDEDGVAVAVVDVDKGVIPLMELKEGGVSIDVCILPPITNGVGIGFRSRLPLLRWREGSSAHQLWLLFIQKSRLSFPGCCFFVITLLIQLIGKFCAGRIQYIQ